MDSQTMREVGIEFLPSRVSKEGKLIRELLAKGVDPAILAAQVADENPSHPFAPPTLSNNTMSVDLMLQSPTRITQMIMDMSLQKFIVADVFSSDGGVSGGAVIYDQAQVNELYGDRDVQEVAPGGEFPIVTAPRLAPKVALVRKWGGKVFITDEAKDRNDVRQFTNKVRQLTNTQVRKVEQNGIAELESSITASGNTVTGSDWSSVVVGGSGQSNADEFPARDFAYVTSLDEQDELGVTTDLWLLNPQEYLQLTVIYGDKLAALLSSLNVRIKTSNRITAGTAYAVQAQAVGGIRIEKPLGSETWREPKTERTWVQSSVRPVFYVTNPEAVRKVTGLAG